MASISACQQPPASQQIKLDSIYYADPVQDAAQAIERSDWRFIAVHNHDLILPLNIPECLVQHFGYRTLSNESFTYMSYPYQLYGALSQTYANWYNYEIFSKLEQSQQYPCKDFPL